MGSSTGRNQHLYSVGYCVVYLFASFLEVLVLVFFTKWTGADRSLYGPGGPRDCEYCQL